MARWEKQQRLRKKEVGGIGVQNVHLSFNQQYKRGYFVDWRVCDTLKKQLLDRIDFYLDTNKQGNPR